MKNILMLFVLSALFLGNSFASNLPQPPNPGEVWTDAKMIPATSKEWNPFAGLTSVSKTEELMVLISKSVFQITGDTANVSKNYFMDQRVQQYLASDAELKLQSVSPRVYIANSTGPISLTYRMQFNIYNQQEFEQQARLARTFQDLAGERQNPDLMVGVNSTDFSKYMERIDSYTGAFMANGNRAVFVNFSVALVKNETLDIPFVNVKKRMVASTKDRIRDLANRLNRIMNPNRPTQPPPDIIFEIPF